MTAVLTWEQPPRLQEPEEHAKLTFDGGPPGAYVPNMDASWQQAWKAKLAGQNSPGLGKLRVEIRKTVFGRHTYAQVLLIVGADGSVVQSMNGKADYTAREWRDMTMAVAEAALAIEEYKTAHNGKAAS